jgi:hypothetical protein
MLREKLNQIQTYEVGNSECYCQVVLRETRDDDNKWSRKQQQWKQWIDFLCIFCEHKAEKCGMRGTFTQ